MKGWGGHVVSAPYVDEDEGAAEAVRRHLARELHDSVVQTLQLMLVEMEQFKHEQFDPRTVINEVSGYQAYTRDVLNELREMLYELRDESVIETGFAEALRSLIASFQARTGIRTRISISRAWPSDIRRVAATHIRRIVEEGLNNVRRHSDARYCRVSLREENAQTLLIHIRDNGVGLPWYGENGAGVGLSGMRERVVLLGGHLSVQPALGGGTALRAVIPRESIS
jgi:signal transduction histidine kinase